jgi:hypothetical protein
MDMHIQDENWVAHACYLLNLTMEDSSVGKPVTGLHEVMIDAGCIPVIVKAMDLHTTSTPESDILQAGCAAISNMVLVRADRHAPLKSRVVREGGAHAMLRAMHAKRVN